MLPLCSKIFLHNVGTVLDEAKKDLEMETIKSYAKLVPTLLGILLYLHNSIFICTYPIITSGTKKGIGEIMSILNRLYLSAINV